LGLKNGTWALSVNISRSPRKLNLRMDVNSIEIKHLS
jgi:hypothetical protein